MTIPVGAIGNINPAKVENPHICDFAATQFRLLWEYPKRSRNLFEVVGYNGLGYCTYNDYHGNFPNRYDTFLKTDLNAWVEMVSTGHANTATGQLAEVLAREAFAADCLPNGYGASIACSDLDFGLPGFDLTIWGPTLMYGSRITSNRIPLLALGIDVVRDESQIVRSASLENKGYAVYVNKFGVPKGLLNMRSYPEQVPGVTPEKLIFKTIDLLQRSASSYYDMQHGFSILECARRTKDFEFLKTFGMYSSDLKRRLRLIILEAANLVKENKPEFRQLYADYLQGLGSSIKV